MGNLVWVGWCPGKKPSHLAKGSHLIMLSRQGFWHLRNGFDDKEIARGHIDLVLKAWLSTGNTAQRIGACYTYPQMGGYFAHASDCDPTNFGEAQGGRPSAWAKENPACGTRVEEDKRQRGKWLIQWKGGKAADRVWIGCPSDNDLIEPKWKWRSFKAPDDAPSGSTQEGKEKEKDDDPSNLEPTAPRSKRSKRAERQMHLRDQYRHWADSLEEAAVFK